MKMVQNNKTVAAVVVTYNRKDLLRKCVLSLLNQTITVDEVIIVDNASTDGTGDMVPLEFPELTYKKLDTNIGGSGGFYEGMKLAYELGHDWIWVMDDDVVPCTETLQELLDYAKIHQNTYCFVPRRLDINGITINQEGLVIDDKDCPDIFIYPDLLSNEYTWINKISFEGPLFRRDCIMKIGLPEKKYFIFFDDVDYGFRLSKIGSIYYVRNAVFKKMLPIDFEFTDCNQWKWYYRWRNFFYFTRKNLKKHATKKLFYWLRTDEDIQFILREIIHRDFSKLKYLLILFLAIWDSFGKMGKKYLPGNLILK